jgi:Tol biopolymer transport system component
MTKHRLVSLGVLLLLLFTLVPDQSASADILMQPITRITGHTGGSYAAISANGRYMVYESVGDSEDGYWNVYFYDRHTARTEIVSLGANGQPSKNTGDYTSRPDVSADGRFIVFMSMASRLVTLETGSLPNIYLRDRHTGVTEQVTVAHNGGTPNGGSWNPKITSDGRFVAFQSHASNLVPGDTNDSIDVFIRDRQRGVTELISVTDLGQQGTDSHEYGYSSLSISDDGRFVAFTYENLPVGGQPGSSQLSVYLRDRQAGTTRRIAAGMFPALTPDGNYLVLVSPDALVPTDKNNEQDVYVYDRRAASFDRISVSATGKEASIQWFFCPPSISADGRFVAFQTSAALVPEDTNNLSDVYMRDRRTGELLLVTADAGGRPGTGDSLFPALSADAGIIAFTSTARNLTSSATVGNHVYFRPFSQVSTLPGEQLQMRIFLPAIHGAR